MKFHLYGKNIDYLTFLMKKIVNQDNVNDRVGFNHVMSMVGVWTLLLHLAAEVWRGRGPVARDIQDDLYSKFAYIFTKVSGYLHI